MEEEDDEKEQKKLNRIALTYVCACVCVVYSIVCAFKYVLPFFVSIDEFYRRSLHYLYSYSIDVAAGVSESVCRTCSCTETIWHKQCGAVSEIRKKRIHSIGFDLVLLTRQLDDKNAGQTTIDELHSWIGNERCWRRPRWHFVHYLPAIDVSIHSLLVRRFGVVSKEIRCRCDNYVPASRGADVIRIQINEKWIDCSQRRRIEITGSIVGLEWRERTETAERRLVSFVEAGSGARARTQSAKCSWCHVLSVATVLENTYTENDYRSSFWQMQFTTHIYDFSHNLLAAYFSYFSPNSGNNWDICSETAFKK